MKCLRCGAGREWIDESKPGRAPAPGLKWVDWIASGQRPRTQIHIVREPNDTHTICGCRITAGRKFRPRPEAHLMMRGNPAGTCYWCWKKWRDEGNL